MNREEAKGALLDVATELAGILKTLDNAKSSFSEQYSRALLVQAEQPSPKLDEALQLMSLINDSFDELETQVKQAIDIVEEDAG